jgi:predicted transcriptional regulator of viral defense system
VPLPPRTFDGAPANTMSIENGSARVLKALPGKRVDPAELTRFIAQEERKGQVVREIAPGQWMIEPAPAGGKGNAP